MRNAEENAKERFENSVDRFVDHILTGDEQTITECLELLGSATNAHERASILRSLIGARGPRVVEAMQDALRDPGEELRTIAVRGLKNAPKCTEALVGALNDPSPHVREEAVHSLAGNDSPKVEDALKRRVLDSDDGVRAAALEVLDASRSQAHIDRLGLPAAIADALRIGVWRRVRSQLPTHDVAGRGHFRESAPSDRRQQRRQFQRLGEWRWSRHQRQLQGTFSEETSSRGEDRKSRLAVTYLPGVGYKGEIEFGCVVESFEVRLADDESSVFVSVEVSRLPDDLSKAGFDEVVLATEREGFETVATECAVIERNSKRLELTAEFPAAFGHWKLDVSDIHLYLLHAEPAALR